jgi:hypothetical protein
MRSILAALLLGATVTGATAGHVFTPTSGSSCSGSSKPQFNVWRCPGPGGFFAEYADEGNMVAVAIASKASSRRGAAATVSFRGSGKVFGDKLQWLVEDGKPQAAILRIWRTETSKEGTESEVQELRPRRRVNTPSSRPANPRPMSWPLPARAKHPPPPVRRNSRTLPAETFDAKVRVGARKASRITMATGMIYARSQARPSERQSRQHHAVICI